MGRGGLASYFARHPGVNVTLVIALFGVLGAMDGYRIHQAREVVDANAWTISVIAGFLLAPMLLGFMGFVLRLVIGDRPQGGLKTVLTGLLAWFVLFGITHPRHSDDSLDHAVEITGAIVADLILVLFVGWAVWNHLVAGPRREAQREESSEPPRHRS